MTSVRRISNVIVSLAWFLLILFLLPVLLVPSVQIWALLLLPILIAAHKIAYGRYGPLTPVDLPIALLLAMVGVSIFATFDIAFSMPKIVNLLYGVVIFYAVTFFASQSPGHFLASSGIQVIIGMGVAIVAFFGTRWSSKLPVLEKIVDKLPQNWINLPGASSGFNSNEVAGVLLWSLPLAFSLAHIIIFRKSDLENVLSDLAIRILRFLAIMGPFLLVFVLLLTQSRSALIGITFSLSFMFFVLVTRNHAKWLKVLLPILLIILVTGSYLFFKIESAPNGAIDDNNSELGLSFLEARQEIWSRALYGIGDFPITGMGMGTFRRVVQVLYPLFVISPNVDIGHAHNHFLQTALDLGIIGLIAYVSLWIGIGVALLQSWKNSSSSLFQDLYLGLSGCLIAYFIYGVTDTVALGARPGFMFWSLLGLVIAGDRLRGDVI